MRIKIHIGFHKCGSTALQFGLARSREALAAQGVIYPASHCFLEAHHQLPWVLMERKRPESEDISPAELMEDWLAEAAAQQAEVMILSSEEFEFLHPAHLQRLKPLLKGHEVEIYVYIRPQDEFLIAEYKQNVRMSATSFSGTADHFYYRHQLNNRFNYLGIIHRWASQFGAANINITSYHRPSLKNQDILADFSDAADLPPFELPLEREHNSSWGNLTAKAMAKINRIGIAPMKREQLARELDAITSRLGLEIDLLDAGARAALMTSFRWSNQKLLTDFKVRGDADRLAWRKIPPDLRIDQSEAMVDLLIQFIAQTIGKE